jgi:hypothetical protein
MFEAHIGIVGKHPFKAPALIFYDHAIMQSSIKHPTRCTINIIFIALSCRHRSTCFGQYCAHHQEPPPTAFAASGYRMIVELDVFQAVVGLPTTA